MSNSGIGYIQAIGGTAAGLGVSLLSPEAGGGLAVSSLMLGGMRLLGASPVKSSAQSVRSMRLPTRKVRTGALSGLDGEDLDALGAVTAMLGDGYDDDDGGDMAAVTAQLGDGDGYGYGYDDDGGDMGAVTAQLGDVEPDEMADGDDDDDGQFSDGDDDDGQFSDGDDDDDD
jgi:hypothetical protein